MTITAIWTSGTAQHSIGGRIEAQCERVAAMVHQSGRPSRIDSDAEFADHVGEPGGELGAAHGSTVGAPILADGRVWGVVLVASTGRQPFAGTTEGRLMGFAELVGTAISNAVARAELNASRARIVAAADASRRRFERDLHDGAQQRLATVALQLRAAALDDTGSPEQLRHELSRAADAVTTALEEVREIAHGIHPAILSEAGLAPALRGLARRSAIPVELAVSTSERLPERVEVAAFYIASELLANVVKHAHASVVLVAAEQAKNALHLSIRDDGRGGADPAHGSGLIGVCDRAEAIGGTIVIDSPAGAGTTVQVSIPLDG
jgi:signal transduction histidine kinase